MSGLATLPTLFTALGHYSANGNMPAYPRAFETNHTVSRLGIYDDVFLRVAPLLKFFVSQRIEMRWL